MTDKGTPSGPAPTKKRRRRGGVPVAPTREEAETAGAERDGRPVGQRFRGPARLVGAMATIQTRGPVLLLTGMSLAAFCLMFPPTGWWWLAYVGLVPWWVCVCTASRSRFVYFASLLLGFAFFLVNIRWMIPVTWPGYLALSAGFSIVFPLAAWPIRHMYRRHGVSVALTAPVVWVALEYLRSITALGFPFLLLGHTQYKNLTMIQISDLVGAYGVSFVLAMINGWITDLLIQPILIWRSERGTRLPVGSLTTLLVVLGTVIYGSAQRSSRYFKPGPKVALVQHDFPMYVDERARRTGPDTIFKAYLALARQAAAEKPDLVLLPETAMSCYVNDEFLDATPADLEEIRQRRFPYRPLDDVKAYQRFSRRVRDAFQALSTKSGVPIVLGSSSLEWRPKAIPPRVEAFNSAFLLEPGETTPADRYDKKHLVMFGEYVPFRTSYYPLYKWLNSFTPWGPHGLELSLSAGSEYTLFEFEAASRDDRPYRAAVPICYEECMPYIAREFAFRKGEARDEKGIDMLLTISNDGWFLHSAELEQHLVSAVFRAVENRIAVGRSVNTGASAQIHPNGRIHDLVAMSEEKINLLGPVAAVLRRLQGPAEKLASQIRDQVAYRKTFDELGRMCLRDLPTPLLAMGPEFTYIHERLRYLLYDTTSGSQEDRLKAVEAFRGQIEEDLATIARWRDRPWTGPGYMVARMKCDDRLSVYSRWGDWFAQGAVALFAMMLLDWLLRRFLWRRRTGREA